MEQKRGEGTQRFKKRGAKLGHGVGALKRACFGTLWQTVSRDNIVITDADKGGAVVILDVEDYIKEAERQLDNSGNKGNINICSPHPNIE